MVVYSDWEPGPTCVHCGRRCGTRDGGFARYQGRPLCCKPAAPDRPDCYRLVIEEYHQLHDCGRCWVPDAAVPSPPRISSGPLSP